MRLRFRSFSRFACLVLLGASALFGLVAPVASDPLPIESWEKAAVEISARYLAEGVGPLLDELHPDGPLAQLAPAAARAEIEARLGPTAGARWTLQTPLEALPVPTAIFSVEYPSGLSTLVFLELGTGEGGRWLLADLRTWADADGWSAASAGAAPVAMGVDAPSATGASGDSLASSTAGTSWKVPILLAACGVLLTLVGFFLSRRGVSIALPVGMGAGVGLLALGVLLHLRAGEAGGSRGENPAGVDGSVVASQGLGTLVELRRSLANGVREEDLDLQFRDVFAATESQPAASRAARLWRAQYLLEKGSLEEASSLLASEALSAAPLSDLLRARLARLERREVEAALAYEQLQKRLPDHDQLLAELLEASAAMGFVERYEGHLQRIAEGDSRSSELQYQLAALAFKELGEPRALAAFRAAWKLRPLERGEVLQAGLWTYLMRRGAYLPLLQLDSAVEPVLRSSEVGSDPMTLPPGFDSTTCGASLELSLDLARISVPNGASIAPAGNVFEDATTRRLRLDDDVLAGLDELLATQGDPASLTRPSLRRRIEAAASALARRQGWDDILSLTNSFQHRPDLLSPELLRLRALALSRRDQADDAARLLLYLVGKEGAERWVSPAVLSHLGVLLAEIGRYDQAIRVLQRAEELQPEAPLVSRVPKVRMERSLEGSFLEHTTEHFHIRYPTQTGVRYIRRLADILEQEYDRLQAWMDREPTRRIEIHLFPAEDFSRHYGGAYVLGLYDGKVRLPFAEFPILPPFIVSVISHELAHAMIDQATDGKAPKWLHEGLAQHTELTSDSLINPIPDFSRQGKLISFPLLEPTLTGFADAELVMIAYDEAEWIFHYIEDVHGRDSIRQLQVAFREGLSTEEAIDRVFDKTILEFDRDFRDWGLKRAPATWRTEGKTYDWI